MTKHMWLFEGDGVVIFMRLTALVIVVAATAFYFATFYL